MRLYFAELYLADSGFYLSLLSETIRIWDLYSYALFAWLFSSDPTEKANEFSLPPWDFLSSLDFKLSTENFRC